MRLFPTARIPLRLLLSKTTFANSCVWRLSRRIWLFFSCPQFCETLSTCRRRRRRQGFFAVRVGWDGGDVPCETEICCLFFASAGPAAPGGRTRGKRAKKLRTAFGPASRGRATRKRWEARRRGGGGPSDGRTDAIRSDKSSYLGRHSYKVLFRLGRLHDYHPTHPNVCCNATWQIIMGNFV